MADSPKREKLVAEIALLRKQQLDSLDNAFFVGWTARATADYEQRADRIELLVIRLAKLDVTP